MSKDTGSGGKRNQLAATKPKFVDIEMPPIAGYTDCHLGTLLLGLTNQFSGSLPFEFLGFKLEEVRHGSEAPINSYVYKFYKAKGTRLKSQGHQP